MKIHEYQGKELFRKYDIPVPNGILATTPAEAKEAAIRLGTPVVVVKAQIHAGGRGKGGGIKIAKSPDEAAAKAAELLGNHSLLLKPVRKERSCVRSLSSKASILRRNFI